MKSYQSQMISCHNTYGFTRPIKKNGEPTSYFTLLNFIKEHPGTSKINILNKLFNYNIQSDEEKYDNRGTKSTTFAALKQAGFIQYGTFHKGSIQITREGRQFLTDAISEFVFGK
jgi:hypothetical protein